MLLFLCGSINDLFLEQCRVARKGCSEAATPDPASAWGAGRRGAGLPGHARRRGSGGREGQAFCRLCLWTGSIRTLFFIHLGNSIAFKVAIVLNGIISITGVFGFILFKKIFICLGCSGS